MTVLEISSKIIPVSGGIAAVTVALDGAPGESETIWIIRGFISLCLAIIAYIVKKMIDDYSKAMIARDAKISDLTKVTAAHDVMYSIWLEQQIGDTEPEGRRKTDQLRKFIGALSETKDA